jgi:hypothetical protein
MSAPLALPNPSGFTLHAFLRSYDVCLDTATILWGGAGIPWQFRKVKRTSASDLRAVSPQMIPVMARIGRAAGLAHCEHVILVRPRWSKNTTVHGQIGFRQDKK